MVPTVRLDPDEGRCVRGPFEMARPPLMDRPPRAPDRVLSVEDGHMTEDETGYLRPSDDGRAGQGGGVRFLETTRTCGKLPAWQRSAALPTRAYPHPGA